MKPADFQDKVALLERPTRDSLLHAALGLASEAGEVASELRLAFVHDRLADRLAVLGELGDCLYYIGMAANAYDVEIGDLFEATIEKLELRKQIGKDKTAERERMIVRFG